MAKSRMITRTIIASRTYKVHTLVDGSMVTLGEEVISGKPSAKAVAKKYDVPFVMLELCGTTKEIYGMEVPDFMEHAILVDRIEE